MPTAAEQTRITVLDEHDLAELPPAGHLMTAVVEIPPGDDGTPPHRHSGPVYGYLLEGEMVFELKGDPPRVIRAGEAFWEPGGDPRRGQSARQGGHRMEAAVDVLAARVRGDGPRLSGLPWVR